MEKEDELNQKIKVLLQSIYGYTDDNNPFGDTQLSKPFIWHKKRAKYFTKDYDMSFIYEDKLLLIKIKEAKAEIDALKKMRTERELNKAPIFQKDLYTDDWKAKDDLFLLNQELLRTEIRIKEGRELPIDLINHSLKIYQGKAPIPTNFYDISAYQKPYDIFRLLSPDYLGKLSEKLQSIYAISVEEIEKDYFESMIYICNSYLYPDQLSLLQNKEIVDTIIKDKSIQEMTELEQELNSKINEEYKTEEIEFWKNALDILKIEKSKMKIDLMVKEFINNHEEELCKIKEMNSQKDNEMQIDSNCNLSPKLFESDEELRKNSLTEHDYLFKLSENRKKFLSFKIDQWQKSLYQNNKEIKSKDKAQKEQTSDDEAEAYLMKISKLNNTKQSSLIPSITNTMKFQFPTNASIIKESRFDLQEEITQNSRDLIEEISQVECEELGDGETMFNDILPIVANYEWANKYKPIKPRYSNRIRIGYEWNKYNQAHYDFDNPPPKVIQGYKFNIFYPYLVDKTKTPEYTLERADCADTCVIRFHAGAPYEDIAFKIANREWDMTERAGFKNIFDKGILRLYFKFKRYRYKR